MMLDKKALKLSEDFNYCIDRIEHSKASMFITGRAGTGKSTLLNLIRKTSKKKLAILAPTGIAALNVKGQTIHSFFGFPPRILTAKDIKKKRNSNLFKKLELIIIDEISMVRADMLDNIDYFLRLNRESPEPFGGVQMVFFGDLFQLPPVLKKEEQAHFDFIYDSPYFFSSKVLEKDYPLEYIELSKVFRQEQKHFLKLLEGVRLNSIIDYEIDQINERFNPVFANSAGYITLSSRNFAVDKMNRDELAKLDGVPHTYQAKIEGEFKPSQAPVDINLNLKIGAQVMFVRNDMERRFVNGTIGKVLELNKEKVIVGIEKENGGIKEIEVEKETWEIIKYKLNDKGEPEAENMGNFTQFPLKLAWAITIHKSQGKTFDKVVIDLDRGAFAHGQTYVALSRCRTLEGIILKKRIKESDIQVDERIIDFYNQYFL
jgi:ATP-dependent DNA helicase PIF1